MDIALPTAILLEEENRVFRFEQESHSRKQDEKPQTPEEDETTPTNEKVRVLTCLLDKPYCYRITNCSLFIIIAGRTKPLMTIYRNFINYIPNLTIEESQSE